MSRSTRWTVQRFLFGFLTFGKRLRHVSDSSFVCCLYFPFGGIADILMVIVNTVTAMKKNVNKYQSRFSLRNDYHSRQLFYIIV